MKIFFQGIVPPILLIVGMVLLRNMNKTSDSAKSDSLKLSPDLYLQQGLSSGKEVLWTLNPPYASSKSLISNYRKLLYEGVQCPVRKSIITSITLSSSNYISDVMYTLEWI